MNLYNFKIINKKIEIKFTNTNIKYNHLYSTD